MTSYNVIVVIAVSRFCDAVTSLSGAGDRQLTLYATSVDIGVHKFHTCDTTARSSSVVIQLSILAGDILSSFVNFGRYLFSDLVKVFLARDAFVRMNR